MISDRSEWKNCSQLITVKSRAIGQYHLSTFSRSMWSIWSHNVIIADISAARAKSIRLVNIISLVTCNASHDVYQHCDSDFNLPGPSCAVFHECFDWQLIVMWNLRCFASNVWSQSRMVHDGSTDILAVNGLLPSYTWHIRVQRCYRAVSADVPDMRTVAGRT